MKVDFNRCISRTTKILIIFISLINIKITTLNAEEFYLRDIEIDSSTKSDGNQSDLPTNPFEIVEMIRRSNSMNDATNPSDAVDEALKSFDMIKDKENFQENNLSY